MPTTLISPPPQNKLATGPDPFLHPLPTPSTEAAQGYPLTIGQTSVIGRQSPLEQRTGRAKTIFLLGLLLAGSGLVSAPEALLGGIAFGFSFDHPLRREASSLSKLLLQLSVVLLGFGIDLHQVLHAGASGFLYTALSIGFALAIGTLLGKLFRVNRNAAYLITLGTAICGGSAIAAIAPITEAREEEISVAMGTVFVLNSIALLLFPPVGRALHLDQHQFGLWAALAIHDTSSVVGAAARYGSQSLAIGTTVKLARALWIVPVSLVTASLVGRVGTPQVAAAAPATTQAGTGGRPGVRVPWFIAFFVLASVASTYLGRFAASYRELNHLGKLGLTATLFLIGTSLSRKMLRQVGVGPLLQGITLWVIVGSASLAAIFYGLIAI